MTTVRINGADRVIEQGTSGIWTYRKWQSGISECWGDYKASIAVNTQSPSYGGYRSNVVSADAYPASLFKENPVVVMVANESQGYWVTSAVNSDKTQPKFYLGCGASLSAANRGVNIHAIGRWK